MRRWSRNLAACAALRCVMPRCVTSRRRRALRHASPPLTDSTCPVT
ncbi:hypothetical protein C7S13_1573 [Burkholderia cepacia]|nr:hypothetical protein [Burkholderia cepacia]